MPLVLATQRDASPFVRIILLLDSVPVQSKFAVTISVPRRTSSRPHADTAPGARTIAGFVRASTPAVPMP